MDDDRKWHLAWAELGAFQKNLPQSVEEKHVAEYHHLLDLLRESSGEDTSIFRIPDQEVKPRITGILRPSFSGRRPGRIDYSDTKYCDRELMLRKLDSLYAYFRSIQPAAATSAKPKYGF